MQANTTEPTLSGANADRARVVLVGHCGPDSYVLKSAAARAIPGCIVSSSNEESTLSAALVNADVLLVNRALDGRFDARDGIELIRRLAGAPSLRPAMILVSNYPEAQAQAHASGAQPGFGKRDVNTDRMNSAIRSALEVSRRSRSEGLS